MSIDVDLLREIAPSARSGLVGPLADAMDKWLPRYGIDTPLRQAHFLAQAACESAGFTTLEELGGPRYFAKYDPGTAIGKRLGNTQPGDGYRFRGRGIFQCTGRANYALYGQKVKADLVGDPELAAEPETSVRIACEYWKAKGLNAWADRDDCREITRRINGGFNGLAERLHYLDKAKEALGAGEPGMPVSLLDVPDAPIAAEAPKSWWQSKIAWASASIGGLSIGNIWANLQDAAYEFTDDPLKTALALVDQHPRVAVLLVILALALYIIAKRMQLLREVGH